MYIKRHEVPSFHIDSQQTVTHCIDVKSKKSKTESITSMFSSQHKEDIARNRYISKEVIDVLILFGRQNIVEGAYQREK